MRAPWVALVHQRHRLVETRDVQAWAWRGGCQVLAGVCTAWQATCRFTLAAKIGTGVPAVGRLLDGWTLCASGNQLLALVQCD